MRYIVLLDDDPDEFFILRSAFEELGSDVQLQWFQDFDELCTFMEESLLLPEMLFLDINLPKQTGIQCLQHLRSFKRYESFPIIMYTNSDYEENINECLALGATVYLKKNNSFESLKRNLKKILNWNLITVLSLPPKDRTILN